MGIDIGKAEGLFQRQNDSIRAFFGAIISVAHSLDHIL